MIRNKILLFSVLLIFMGCAKEQQPPAAYISLEALPTDGIKDKVTIFFSWASWCPHCQEAMPEVMDLYNNEISQNKDFLFFTINIDKTSEDIVAYHKKVNMPQWPIYWDQDRSLTKKLNITGIPSFLVIDKRDVNNETTTFMSLDEFRTWLESNPKA